MVNHLNTKQVTKLLLAVLLPVFISKQVFAQQFSSLYYENRPLAFFGSCEYYSGNNYLTGLTAAIDTPYYLKGLFGKVLADGSLVYLKGAIDTLPYSYQFYRNALHKTADGNFIVCGEMIDTLGKVFIAKFDTNGNMLFKKEFIDTTLELFHSQDVLELPGEGYLIAINVAFQNLNSAAVIIRTDTAGNILNKKVHDLNATEYPWLLRPMFNGNFMVGAVTHKTANSSAYWCRTWLIEIDSMGNYVNQWIDTDNKNLWPYGMQQTADSGWIIVRQHLAYDVSGFQKYNAGIVKYDKNFTKEWEHYYGDSSDVTGFYDVEILPDGKYIVCGTTPIWGSDSAHRFGWIVKFDTDGTMLWERKYVALERNGTHSYLYDIDVLPNGDLLACGELRFTFNVGITPIQQGWILRTDSNGCVIENCLTGIDIRPETTDEREILLWPNPASNFIEVVIESDMEMADIHIYNLTGALVLEQKANRHNNRIDVSQLSKGMYVVSAEKQGRFLKAKLVIE